MLNQIFLMGRLVADPALQTTPGGVPVCAIRLAVDRDYKNKDGERETDFINVVSWNNTAEFISRNLSKGRNIVVVGRLQIRNFTDRDGNKRTAAEVHAQNVYFADSRRDTTSVSNYDFSTEDNFSEQDDSGQDLPF